MSWEFETADGHTIRVAVSADGVAVSTRMVNGAVDGEVFDLDTFEHTVLPGMEAIAGEAVVGEIREAVAAAREKRDRDDDDVP